MPHKRRVKGSHQTKLLFQPEKSFLYLEYFHSEQSESLSVPLHTLIPIFVIKYIKSNNIQVYLYKTSETKHNPFSIQIKKSSFDFEFCDQLPEHVAKCRLPCWYLPSQLTCLAGLCSVVRYIVKMTAFPDCQDKSVQKCIELLGHQYGCLSAPAEVSTWTKFCELDMPMAIHEFFNSDSPNLPEELSKFEAHLDQPIRIHNVRKRMQDAEKENSNPQANGKADPIHSYAKSNHIFAEGPDLLISDIMLYPCISIIFQAQEKCVRDQFPLVSRWFDHINTTTHVADSLTLLSDQIKDERNFQDAKAVEVPIQSLYKCDPSRDSNKICTSQLLVEKNIDWWQESGLMSGQTYGDEDGESEEKLSWDQLPKLVHPQAGDLPADRLERKCQQLQGLALPIVNLAGKKKNPVIVDFCSGGGHLGLLLAYLIPKSIVHMVENKEESLARARERGVQLGLTNVWYFQSNIDYYQGHFDIGTSLHACGVATDLVIQKSADASADCVTCPCCYGAVQRVEGIEYPRSAAFANSGCTLDDYILMGHTADQTERQSTKCLQGEMFMDIVDTDRCLHLTELGYKTTLTKIAPLTCSPKHNLIIAALPEKLASVPGTQARAANSEAAEKKLTDIQAAEASDLTDDAVLLNKSQENGHHIVNDLEKLAI